MTVTQKIIAEARAIGLTRAEIAELCGVRPATVSDWASGKQDPLAKIGPLLTEIGALGAAKDIRSQ